MAGNGPENGPLATAPSRSTIAPGRNAATRIVDYLLNSDVIQFLVGTRINEAHQDPSVPVELDLRRNLMKRIARSLEDRHLKETRIRYL